jgi:hypothetical protein
LAVHVESVMDTVAMEQIFIRPICHYSNNTPRSPVASSKVCDRADLPARHRRTGPYLGFSDWVGSWLASEYLHLPC